jgi:hypothetical protein
MYIACRAIVKAYLLFSVEYFHQFQLRKQLQAEDLQLAQHKFKDLELGLTRHSRRLSSVFLLVLINVLVKCCTDFTQFVQRQLAVRTAAELDQTVSSVYVASFDLQR